MKKRISALFASLLLLGATTVAIADVGGPGSIGRDPGNPPRGYWKGYYSTIAVSHGTWDVRVVFHYITQPTQNQCDLALSTAMGQSVQTLGPYWGSCVEHL